MSPQTTRREWTTQVTKIELEPLYMWQCHMHTKNCLLTSRINGSLDTTGNVDMCSTKISSIWETKLFHKYFGLQNTIQSKKEEHTAKQRAGNNLPDKYFSNHSTKSASSILLNTRVVIQNRPFPICTTPQQDQTFEHSHPKLSTYCRSWYAAVRSSRKRGA